MTPIARLRTAVTVLGAALLACGPPRPSLPRATPQPGDSHRLQSTRAELETRFAQLGMLAHAGHLPRGLAAESTYIERRLEWGDFRAGDRIRIAVEDPLPGGPDRPTAAAKSPEQQLSDTFTVATGQDLVLPAMGSVSLHGVLRAELEPFLTKAIGRFIRDPVVHAWPLFNLAVTGEVARPGFYAVPADAPVSAVLTAAGGPTKDAQLNKLQIERDGRAVWKGRALGRAVEQGRTLEQIGVQPGDVLDVPARHDVYRTLQIVGVLATITVAVYAISTHIHF